MKVHRDECRPDNLVPTTKFFNCIFFIAINAIIVTLHGCVWTYWCNLHLR